MSIELQPTGVSELPEVLHALSSWQRDDAPVQLHPGDLGWHWRFGPRPVATALRIWRYDGEIVAIGFVDGVGLVRIGIAPAADEDGALATRLVDDLSDPARGVLPTGDAAVEARAGTALRALLAARGWGDDEAWVPLHRDLGNEVMPAQNGLRIEVVNDADSALRWLEVVRVAFGSAPTPPDRWANLAASPMLQQQLGRCLLGYDSQDAAVAAVAVWSAGAGRPGLVEPMGVHEEHRGRGHGVGITLAAAAELRSMGSSSAVIATPAARPAAVATYAAAGFSASGQVTDFRRPS